MEYQWDFSIILRNAPLLMQGLWVTIKLSIGSVLFSVLIGLVIGVARVSSWRILQWFGWAYVEVFRNIPGIVQLFWFYYTIPILTGWQSTAWMAALVTLSVYNGAYCAEIYRAGILSVDRGQWEGSKALGFRGLTTLRLIILPQAIQKMVPAFTNRIIEIFKTTTLASTLALGELLYMAKIVAEDEFRPLEAYTAVAVIFTLILVPVSYLCFRLERKMAIAGSK